MYIYKTDLYLYIKNVYRSINQSTMYFKGRGLRAGSQCNREMKLFGFFSFFLTHRLIVSVEVNPAVWSQTSV